MDSISKSKKRKISDFFTPLPKRIIRTQRTKDALAKDAAEKAAKDAAEKAAELSKPLTKNSSPVNATTQTVGTYKMNQMEEGKQFLAERIFNFEAQRIHGGFEMCSIADKRFDSENHISWQAIDYLQKIQEKDDGYYEWRLQHTPRLKHETLIVRSKYARMIDQMTQYGEDNPNEDFTKGMNSMVDDIIRAEESRLELYRYCFSSDDDGSDSDGDGETDSDEFNGSSDEPSNCPKRKKPIQPIDIINRLAHKMTDLRSERGMNDEGPKWYGID